MSNASLKEQLQAVATQLSEKPPQKRQDGERKPSFKRQPPPSPRQEAKVNKPRPKWLDSALYGVELLKTYFPQCFKPANEVKPLKKGIKQDLVKFLSTMEAIVTEDKACMIKTLSYYVNTAAYHKCVLEGVTRIDLEGNPSGVVSAEEAKYSIERQQLKLRAKQTAASNLPAKTKEEVTQ